MKKRVPTSFKTDRQAEAFLAQDLSNLDFSQFKAARFEFEKKDEQINMRDAKSHCWQRLRRGQKRAASPTHASFGKRSERAMATPK